MFRFKALELMNWDCYPHYRVPMDGEILLLVGQNGSGKTTFLDALRVLLNGPRLSKSRNLHHYIQSDVEVAMIKAVVTNQLVNGKRPFSHLGIYGDTDVSIICLLHNRGAQRIEKEYFIEKGDIATDEIAKLKNGIKPLQYSRQMEEAGVSRSTLKLIALEQGQTDRIGQLSPKDLLELVMDITGNRDIIKRYEEAKRNYQGSYQQLVELRTEYNKICMQTQDLEKQAREAQNFKELIAQKNVIELEKLPLSRWYQILNQIHEAERVCHELLDKKSNLERQNQMTLQQQEQLKASRDEFEKTQTAYKEELLEQERKLNLLHQQIGQCHSQWQRLDELRRACEANPTNLSLAAMTSKLEEVQGRYYQHKNELTQFQKTAETSQKELHTLKQQKLPSYPSEVYDFRNMLAQTNIQHQLFAECIEVNEPFWQLAIEAFLARDRFTIFLDENDVLKGKKMGERNRYGYYISRYRTVNLPKIRPNSILSFLTILDQRVGERLLPLNDVILVKSVEEGHDYQGEFITITPQGYRQDRRGGIFIANNVRFYCGGIAVERQVKELEEESLQTVKKIEELHQLLYVTTREIKEIEDKMVLLKKQEEWETSKEEYHQLKTQGEELVKTSETYVQERNRLKERLDKLIEARNQSIRSEQELYREVEKFQRDRQQLSEALMGKEQILLQLRWQKEQLDKQLPANATKSYTPEELEPPQWLEHKIQEIERDVQLFAGCRDFAMISLYQHEMAQLESKQKQLARQEEDQGQRSQELEKCRDDYRDMINHTINFYNKAVKELSDLAGCRMRILLELGSGETLVEDAKLHAKVSFDQKVEVDIHDKSLSGGQDVIASLILLVALSRMEQESTGFFIMDEHNAHLDMLRIMEVGHFLRSTKAQFVLTTPTTENMAALAVADLIVTFTKKTANDKTAPKPRFIRRA